MRAYFIVLALCLSSLVARSDQVGAAPSPGPSPTATPENRAVRVILHGGFTGFDEGAYTAFRSVAAGLLLESVLGKFITEDYVLDGGGVFCLELAHNPTLNLTRITDSLKSVSVDSQTTYSYTSIPQCN